MLKERRAWDGDRGYRRKVSQTIVSQNDDRLVDEVIDYRNIQRSVVVEVSDCQVFNTLNSPQSSSCHLI